MPSTTHAPMSAGTERGYIVQIQGDGNTVVSGLPHLRLTRYRTRNAVDVGIPGSAGFTHLGEREADLLRAHTEALPFVGRSRDRAQLDAWLDGPAPISVHVLTGRGGRGKTRLALELCRARAAAGWRAGFITGREMERFRAQANLAEWGWNAPTLVVLDYAAASASALYAWLAELADNDARLSRGGPALRLLLLERHAVPGEGWWAEAFGYGGGDANAIATLLDSPKPDALEAVDDPVERRAIFAAAYRRAAGSAPQLLPALDAQLAKLSWGGEPLFLAMAGVLAARVGIGPALALPPDELAFEQARRELARVQAIWEGHGLHKRNASFGMHLAALATLRGGLPREHAHAVIRAERTATGFDGAGDPEPIRAALHNVLPGPEGGIAPIEPDPLGEAVILECWKGWMSAEGQTAAVLRAYWDAPDAVAAVLVRTCQDFAIRGRREAVEWLRAVCAEIGDEPAHLRNMLAVMPQATVELGEIAVGLTQAWLRHLPCGSEEERSDLAMALNNLSVRLAGLGRREDALAALEDAVALYRELAAARSDAFTPNLALALNNLSNHLAALGWREDALAAAEEAVALRRELVGARLDAFTLDLASALNNMSNRLAELGRRKDALAAIEEAVALHRKLAGPRPDASTPNFAMALTNLSNSLAALGWHEDALAAAEEAVALRRELVGAHPDAFTPDLAVALNNLSNRLAALGRPEDALSAIEESVALYRKLAGPRPDAFTSNLAMALSNLSNNLAKLGRREDALSVIEEAVALHRKLAVAHPNAFTPDLATALSNLSSHFADLGRREDALAAVEEAVALRRELARERPDALTPKLARSLWMLGSLYAESGQPNLALSPLHEGVERLAPAFAAIPAAFYNLMAGLVQSYIATCETLGHEPDMVLLSPVLALLDQLRSIPRKE